MTISLKHSYVSLIADAGDADLVQPSDWNAEHALTATDGKLLGASGSTTVGEITPSTGLTLAAGNLSVADYLSATAAAAAYQPLDSDLTAIAALATTTFGRAFLALADEAAFKAAVNLEIGTDVQAYDADLTTWAGLTPSANHQTLVTQTFAQMRGSLDLEAGTDFYSITAADAAFQPKDADLTTWAGLTPSANAQSLVTAANYAAMKGLLDLEIGTDVQAYDAQLDEWAGVDPSTNGKSLVEAADYAAMRALLDLEAGTDFYSKTAADAAFQPLDSDLTSIAALATTTAGRSVLTIADPNADRVIAWDDSAGAMAAIALADITDEAAPAAGDYLLLYGAEGDLRKVDWSELPSGSGISEVAEDTDPELGGGLDLNNFDITGTGNIAITGGTTLTGALSVSGATTLRGGVTVSGGLSISGGTTTLGATNVSGAVTISSAGDTTVNGALNAAGGVTVSGGLIVSAGATSLRGGAAVSGGLTVSGGTTTLGATNVSGAVVISTAGSTTINGASIFAGGVQVSGGLTVSNGTTTLGAANVSGTVVISSAGTTTVNGALNAAGSVVISGGVTISGGNVTAGPIANSGTASFGTTFTHKIGFYGATPISQRSGAAQVTVSYSGTTGGCGWSTSAKFNAFVLLVNTMQRDLVALGLIKGGA